jgi:hypothetical protein
MIAGKTEYQIQTEERREATPFQQYMQVHRLEALSISAQIHVRYCLLWRAMKGMPISVGQARAIRVGIAALTGIPYTGPLMTGQTLEHDEMTAAQALDQLPTLPLKRVTPDTREDLFPAQTKLCSEMQFSQPPRQARLLRRTHVRLTWKNATSYQTRW